MKKSLLIIGIALLYSSCEKYDEDYQQYLDRLKEYSSYNNEETCNYSFSYMDQDDANLQHIKQKYDLETIAGNGDELSRITNLMFWVNENLEHDGTAEKPYPPNAENIIETCVRENRGVNCRMLATILNEFYLAMGFRSRFVTCMPYEHNFTDCHVVTIVHSNQLNKWIMMDPSFAGYFQDENDVYMDLAEVREKLINGESLLISDFLNHNGDTYTKQEYKTYITKNLFRFNCPENSEYNYEALNFNERQYIELIPLNYEPEESNCIYTRNSANFWTIPQK